MKKKPEVNFFEKMIKLFGSQKPNCLHTSNINVLLHVHVCRNYNKQKANFCTEVPLLHVYRGSYHGYTLTQVWFS